MKAYLILLLSLACLACGSAPKNGTSVAEDLEEKNRMSIPLVDRIRRLPGVTLRNGVPVFTKTTANISGTGNPEPLYVLDGQILGHSFKVVEELVENVNIASLKALTGPEASFYGARGGNGVILLKTRN